ncbi:MAG TPA: hypothetical protein VK993_02745 [Chthoniobacterales bacterium]|nr:hypothetical protein [Chthoniobacterales bacterium]
MNAPASLRALLERSIDYAGLFPPASLPLEPALKNHAAYVRSADASMLGAFILPIAQFDAASAMLEQFDAQHPIHISALAPKTDNPDAFRAAVDRATRAIHALLQSYSDRASVTQLEMPLPPGGDAQLLAGARELLESLPAFWEAPADAAERTVAMLAEHNSAVSAGARPFGFKLRTGGVTADAFPSSTQIARALVASAKHHVPIKFTAGLHHPVRQFHSTVETKMHGFLNVLGAAALAVEHGWDEKQTAEMLDDEDASAFRFDADAFSWRDASIGTDQIRVRRELVTSLGSCSFDEPREDLRVLNLL